jgi:hypothetical protein
MKYKYRSTSRFPVLIILDDTFVEVRPNQIIESETQLKNSNLKLIEPEPPTPKKPRRRRSGNNNLPQGE